MERRRRLAGLTFDDHGRPTVFTQQREGLIDEIGGHLAADPDGQATFQPELDEFRAEDQRLADIYVHEDQQGHADGKADMQYSPACIQLLNHGVQLQHWIRRHHPQMAADRPEVPARYLAIGIGALVVVITALIVFALNRS